MLKQLSDSKIPQVNECGVDVAAIGNPQLCAIMVRDIYKNLRASEVKKRPWTKQKDIDSNIRAELVNWLVDVAENYKLDCDETLYLSVNYIDRYLSGNTMDRERLQLLGVACMMIASKYEGVASPSLEELCDITDNTYNENEILKMESTVLKILKYELTVPTVRCFLRLFVCAADEAVSEDPLSELECMSNYLAELSLLDYRMLSYAPSMIAASSVFLARYILLPSTRPWNSALHKYTLYKPSHILKCVKALHSILRNSLHSDLLAIGVKYGQHKFKRVAMKYCPTKIPPEYFHEL